MKMRISIESIIKEPYSNYLQEFDSSAPKGKMMPSILYSLMNDSETSYYDRGQPVVIIKQLPKPDIIIQGHAFFLEKVFAGRNRVVAANDMQEKGHVILKLYKDAEHAANERRILLALQKTEFACHLPKVMLAEDFLIMETLHQQEPCLLEERIKILAQLHAQEQKINAFEINIPEFEKPFLAWDFYHHTSRDNKITLKRVYEDAAGLLQDRQRVLVHGDPKPANWVGAILIDWESAGYGYRERDLARLFLDERLSEKQVHGALCHYAKAIAELENKDYTIQDFKEFCERFEAARFIEALRKIVTRSERHDRNISYFEHLVNTHVRKSVSSFFN